MITPIISSIITGDSTLLLSALAALSTVIALFWRIIHSNHRETKERGDKLEIKLENNNTQLITLTDEMGELRGRVTLAEEVSPKLDSIAKGIDDLSARLAGGNTRSEH